MQVSIQQWINVSVILLGANTSGMRTLNRIVLDNFAWKE